MAYQKVNFTRPTLSALPPAASGKRDYYTDTKEPGLLLSITSTGTKSFQVYIKQSGRPVRVTLGRFNGRLADTQELPRDCTHSEFLSNTPELNVRMARALAALVKIDLKAGVRPADTKRARRAELTLGELFEKYVEDHMIAEGKRSVVQTREHFERYLGQLPAESTKKHGRARQKGKNSVNWQNRLIGSISKAEIRKLISELGHENSPYTANRTLILLKSMFNRAIDWQIYDKANPVKGIKEFKVESRERFLQADELPRFFYALSEEPSKDVRDYVLVSALTGGRKSNVLAMRWADLNLERAVWTVSGAESKNTKKMTIPLVAECVAVLQSRKPKEAAVYVFPGPGKSGHMEGIRRGWKRLFDFDEVTELTKRIKAAGEEFEWPIPREKGYNDKSPVDESLESSLHRARQVAAGLKIDTVGARLEEVHIHDLRRTIGSWQAATGASLVIIGKSLGHKDVNSTLIYSRLNIDPVRDSMHTATQAMFAAGGLLPTADVTPIKEARNKRKGGSR